MSFLFAASLGSASDGTPSSGGSPPTYITVGDIVGEIVKVDNSSITIRVTWYTQQPPRTTSGNRNTQHYGNWHRGTSNRNPQQMHQHMLQMQQQLRRNMAQSQQRAANAKPQEHHVDYVMNFAVDATARLQHLPPKTDQNGKKVPYTPEEYQKLKGNPQVPGYKADLSDLKPGQLVEAHIVRLPGSQNTKDKSDDQIVRWAMILNEDHVGKTPAAKSPVKK